MATRKITLCDCPACRPQTRLERFLRWLEEPPGPWATVSLIAFIFGLALAYYYLLPDPAVTMAAGRG